MKKLKTEKEVSGASVAVSNLVKFKRWLSGRGRKYVAGQSTVEVDSVCWSLAFAIDQLRHSIGDEQFKTLVRMAQCTSVPLGDNEKSVLRAAKRIVRHIDKADAR